MRKSHVAQRGYDYFPKKPSQKSKNSLELEVESPINNQQRHLVARQNKINGALLSNLEANFQRNSEIKDNKTVNPF